VLEKVRLFGVLGTWMEEDVVSATIWNAFTQGCERVYVIDNGSPDGTVAAAIRAGAVMARSFATQHYDEHLRLWHMNDVVAEVSAAEPDDCLWWLYFDADEFIHGPYGMSVLDYLKTLDRLFRVVGARFFNHFPSGVPQYVSGHHPLDFQPLCEELAYQMCPSWHRKHPLLRQDRRGPRIQSGRGFHVAKCAEELIEPAQPAFVHHFPFRHEASTRRRLNALWARDARGSSRAIESDDATFHMRPRFRSLDAVYRQQWSDVENFINPGPGVKLRPWSEMVESEHVPIHRWTEMVGTWRYEGRDKFSYGDDTTYRKGLAFLDGHGTIEDWGCGWAHARTFVRRSAYVGVDGSSPHADRIVDLRTYVSDVDCIFMRHVLEHNLEWRRILTAALSSFRKRLVLIIFTPFVEATRVLAVDRGVTAVPVPDIAFRREELVAHFGGLHWRQESMATESMYSIEHIFYLSKGSLDEKP
jgi:hypothetical protein